MTRPATPLHIPTHELRCLARPPARRAPVAQEQDYHNALVQVFPLLCLPVLEPDGRPRTVRQWEHVGGAVRATPDGALLAMAEGRPLRFGIRCPENKCAWITVYQTVIIPAPRRRIRPEALARLAGR